MFDRAAIRSNSTASARSIFVITAASALLKIVGYFSGLSSPPVTDSRTRVLAQVERCRADQVPDILDEQTIKLGYVPACDRLFHHRRFEVAHGSGRDLFHRGQAARESCGVVLGGKIAHERRRTKTAAQFCKRSLEKRRFARAWTGDKAYDEYAGSVKPLPQGSRHFVVVLQDILAHFDDPWTAAHDGTRKLRLDSSFSSN